MVVVDLTEIDDDEMTDAEALERALALSMGDIEPNNKNADDESAMVASWTDEEISIWCDPKMEMGLCQWFEVAIHDVDIHLFTHAGVMRDNVDRDALAKALAVSLRCVERALAPLHLNPDLDVLERAAFWADRLCDRKSADLPVTPCWMNAGKPSYFYQHVVKAMFFDEVACCCPGEPDVDAWRSFVDEVYYRVVRISLVDPSSPQAQFSGLRLSHRACVNTWRKTTDVTVADFEQFGVYEPPPPSPFGVGGDAAVAPPVAPTPERVLCMSALTPRTTISTINRAVKRLDCGTPILLRDRGITSPDQERWLLAHPRIAGKLARTMGLPDDVVEMMVDAVYAASPAKALELNAAFDTVEEVTLGAAVSDETAMDALQGWFSLLKDEMASQKKAARPDAMALEKPPVGRLACWHAGMLSEEPPLHDPAAMSALRLHGVRALMRDVIVTPAAMLEAEAALGTIPHGTGPLRGHSFCPRTHEPLTDVFELHGMALETLKEILANALAASPDDARYRTLSGCHPRIDLLRHFVPAAAPLLLGCGFECIGMASSAPYRMVLREGEEARGACLAGLNALADMERALHTVPKARLLARLDSRPDWAPDGGYFDYESIGDRRSLEKLPSTASFGGGAQTPLGEAVDGEQDEELQRAIAASLAGTARDPKVEVLEGESAVPTASEQAKAADEEEDDDELAAALALSMTSYTADGEGTAGDDAAKGTTEAEADATAASSTPSTGAEPKRVRVAQRVDGNEHPTRSSTRSRLRSPPADELCAEAETAEEALATVLHVACTPIMKQGEAPSIGIMLNMAHSVQEGTPRVVIERTVRGSPAEAAGLRAMDQLMSISGTRVSDLEDASTLLEVNKARRKTGDDASAAPPVRLVVLRPCEALRGVHQLKTACPAVFDKLVPRLQEVLRNVTTHPTEPKFRTMRLANRNVDEILSSLTGAQTVLEMAGFARCAPHAAGGRDEDVAEAVLELSADADLGRVAKTEEVLDAMVAARAALLAAMDAARVVDPLHGLTIHSCFGCPKGQCGVAPRLAPWVEKLMPMPADAALCMRTLRFRVGAHVRCQLGTWRVGVVTQQLYWESDFPRDRVAAYQVEALGVGTDGRPYRVMVPRDTDQYIRSAERLDMHDGEAEAAALRRADPHRAAMIETMMDMLDGVTDAVGLAPSRRDSNLWMRAYLEHVIPEGRGPTAKGREWLADLRRAGDSGPARAYGAQMIESMVAKALGDEPPCSGERRGRDDNEDDELQRALAMSLADANGRHDDDANVDRSVARSGSGTTSSLATVEEVPQGSAGPSQISVADSAVVGSPSHATADDEVPLSDKARGKRAKLYHA